MSTNPEIPEEFFKIIKDFITDIINTFPEYEPIIMKWWKPKEFQEIVDSVERETAINNDIREKTKYVFNHCVTVFPERFFDILYQKDDIFKTDTDINTEFLPGISFKYLWTCDISDKTRETIWKYMQMILFSIIGSIKNRDAFGDTAKLFNSINEEEFKGKLEETLEKMQNIFSKTDKENVSENVSENETDKKSHNMPSADDIHSHINSMIGGKLGDLAREIAEETAENLNVDMENITDVKDVFQELFKNPGKLMNMVKTVGEKLDSRLKSGDIKESDLMSEASDIMNKMKNMPGMENIQEMMSKLGMDGLGGIAGLAGLGKNTKLDTNAMQQRLDKNMKAAAFKERLKKKMEMKQLEALAAEVCKPINANANALSDEQLVSMFSTGDKVERTPRTAKPNTDDKKKNKTKK